MSDPSSEVKRRLALALDVDDDVRAMQLARELKPFFGVAKVGLELFTAFGPEMITRLIDEGYRVFLDLKMVDIPTTVGKAARVVGSLGASYLTMYGQGGVDMLNAGTEGMLEGAAAAGLPAPTPLAITILTSDADAPRHILAARLRGAMEAGCKGIVCAAGDLEEVRLLAPRMTKVVPGIRPLGVEANDQARSSTPSDAIALGADLLVIGRAVTHAPDRVAAAAAIAAEVDRALGALPT
jgi:orotidine-5'-phosphate decarboxylase